MGKKLNLYYLENPDTYEQRIVSIDIAPKHIGIASIICENNLPYWDSLFTFSEMNEDIVITGNYPTFLWRIIETQSDLLSKIEPTPYTTILIENFMLRGVIAPALATVTTVLVQTLLQSGNFFRIVFVPMNRAGFFIGKKKGKSAIVSFIENLFPVNLGSHHEADAVCNLLYYTQTEVNGKVPQFELVRLDEGLLVGEEEVDGFAGIIED